MRIAVIGMGNVGSALGRSWAETGHQVTFGVRDLVVPGSAVPDAPKASGDLSGKVLRGCNNPVTPVLTHLTIAQSTSAGMMHNGH